MHNPLPNGCGVALITPFQSNGQLDEPALERMVDHVIEGGVDFIVALGTTGESVTQSRDECKHVMRRIHDFVKGRVPLVAGPFGGNSTSGVIERMEAYSDILELPNYVALMSSVPSYVKPSQEGIYQHFMAVADASPLPVLLYNVPSRTGVHMTAATTARLAHATKKIFGVKEASGSMTEGMLLLRDCPAGFIIYSGDDTTALPLIACGAHGVISVVANAYPDIFSTMADAALAGDLATARKYNTMLLDLHPLLYCDGNPAGIKAVLDQLGLCGPEVRLPLVEVGEATSKALVNAVLRVQAERAPGLV